MISCVFEVTFFLKNDFLKILLCTFLSFIQILKILIQNLVVHLQVSRVGNFQSRLWACSAKFFSNKTFFSARFFSNKTFFSDCFQSLANFPAKGLLAREAKALKVLFLSSCLSIPPLLKFFPPFPQISSNNLKSDCFKYFAMISCVFEVTFFLKNDFLKILLCTFLSFMQILKTLIQNLDSSFASKSSLKFSEQTLGL